MSKRGKNNKKGISPLIATVLIVGFVIALSAMFWVFFSNTVKEQIDKQGAEGEGSSKCLNVNVKFADCEKVSDKWNVKVKNEGKQEIVGINVRAKVGDKTTAKPDYVNLKPGSTNAYKTGVSSEGGSIIEEGSSFIPYVSAKGYAYPCSDKIISFQCPA